MRMCMVRDNLSRKAEGMPGAGTRHGGARRGHTTAKRARGRAQALQTTGGRGCCSGAKMNLVNHIQTFRLA
jgi:hypothetical protein